MPIGIDRNPPVNRNRDYAGSIEERYGVERTDPNSWKADPTGAGPAYLCEMLRYAHKFATDAQLIKRPPQ